jgi:hypothetical protein
MTSWLVEGQFFLLCTVTRLGVSKRGNLYHAVQNKAKLYQAQSWQGVIQTASHDIYCN